MEALSKYSVRPLRFKGTALKRVAAAVSASHSEAVKSISPSKSGFNEDDVPIDLRAVPEGFDVSVVDGYDVDQSASPDSVTGWRKRKTLSGCLFSIQVSLSLSIFLSLGLSTFRTRSVAGFAVLDSVLLHLVRSSAADT